MLDNADVGNGNTVVGVATPSRVRALEGGDIDQELVYKSMGAALDVIVAALEVTSDPEATMQAE